MNRSRRRRIACSLLLAALMASQSIGFAQTTLDGFAPKLSENQRRREEQFRGVPSATNAREELRRLTAEAHIAGSPEDYATAGYVCDQMRRFGVSSDMREDQVRPPVPRTPRIVELIAPRHD